MRIIVIDKRDARRRRIASELSQFPGTTIYDVGAISAENLESSEFDVVLIHNGNREAPPIESGTWDTKDARLIFFSGSLSRGTVDYLDGCAYLSEDALFDILPDITQLVEQP